MILVFIFIFLILGCIFSKVSVYVKNFNLQNSKKGLNTIFNIKLKFKLYGIIPFLVINLTEEGSVKSYFVWIPRYAYEF